jgi:hypothetical protein
MKTPSNHPSIRNRTFESIGAIITEIFDAPILLLYSTFDSGRELLFQSGIEPVGIPEEKIWKTYTTAKSNNIVHLEDLRVLDREKNHFEALLGQGIQCCCKLDLVNDQKEKLGELFIMDYASRIVNFPEIHLLESIRDLTTHVLERDLIDREILREKEDSRSINRIVREATELSGSGGFCLNLHDKTLFWYKSNNVALDLPNGFQLSYSDLLEGTQSYDPVLYPQLLAFSSQVRQGIKNLRTKSAEGTLIIPLEKTRHFHYSIHKNKEILYLVFKDNTMVAEMGIELARIQSLLKAEESEKLTAAWTLKLKDEEMS